MLALHGFCSRWRCAVSVAASDTCKTSTVERALQKAKTCDSGCSLARLALLSFSISAHWRYWTGAAEVTSRTSPHLCFFACCAAWLPQQPGGGSLVAEQQPGSALVALDARSWSVSACHPFSTASPWLSLCLAGRITRKNGLLSRYMRLSQEPLRFLDPDAGTR